MNRPTRSNAKRETGLAQRGVEMLLGAVLSVIGVFMCLLVPFAVISFVTEPSSSDSPLLFRSVVLIILGAIAAWCVQTGWRLMTGRERPGGGLLSPLALIVIGVACVAGSIAEVL